MNYDNTYEQEIDLKDLCFYFMYRWRPILLAAVVLALAAGGFKTGKELLSWKDTQMLEESRADYEEKLALYESNVASYELNIENFSQKAEAQQIYMEHSILMQMDPYQKPAANADVQIQMAESAWRRIPDSLSQDPADGIVRSYGANVIQGTDWTPVEKLTGVEAVYLKELVEVSWDFDSNQVSLTVSYPDLETAEKILDELLAQMQSREQELSRAAGAHTITVVNRASGICADLLLADQQRQNSDRMDTYQRILTDKEKALNSLQKPELPAELSRRQAVKSGVKYMILGGVAGGFLMVFLYGILYLMGPKLRSGEAVQSQYGYRVLGAFSLPERTGFLCGIDRWLERLEGTAARPSEEAVLTRAAVNIRNYAGEAREILVTGTVPLERIQELCSRMQKDLDKIRLIPCGNPNVDTDTLKRLADCEGVVLVEERGVSLNREIMKEKEMLDSLKKQVIGCVVI